MAELPRGPPGAGRLFLAAVVTFLAAVVLARLLLQGDWAWGLAALALPGVVVVLRLTLGTWLLALLLAGFFVAAVLLLRLVLASPQLGWSLFLLALLFLVSSLMAARVLATLVVLSRTKSQDAEKERPSP